MTNEEIIICKMYLNDLDSTHDCNEYKLLMGLLEQQPSDDCISREGARQFLYEEIDRLNNDELYDIFSKIIDDMYNELPPVTPKIPTSDDYVSLEV